MRRPALLLLASLPALLSCTALGGWLYDDPSFALRSVAARPGPPGTESADSLDLVFEGCNRNDYDLIGNGFRSLLRVGGEPVAEGEREQPVLLATRDTSSFVVTVPLRRADLILGGKKAQFELDSRATLHTPIGDRAVIFNLRGQVEPGAMGGHWAAIQGPGCHPGQTGLPYQFQRRVDLARPD